MWKGVGEGEGGRGREGEGGRGRKGGRGRGREGWKGRMGEAGQEKEKKWEGIRGEERRRVDHFSSIIHHYRNLWA